MKFNVISITFRIRQNLALPGILYDSIVAQLSADIIAAIRRFASRQERDKKRGRGKRKGEEKMV